MSDTTRVTLARWQSKRGRYWTEVVRIGDRYQVTADFNTPGKGLMEDSLEAAIKTAESVVAHCGGGKQSRTL